MANAQRALLPKTSELAALSDAQVREVLAVVDHANRREHSYAVAALICGTVSFLADLGVFAYLIVMDSPKAASAVLGTGLLAIIGRMVGARLQN